MGAYPGGLCEHALIVAHELGVLCNAYYPGRYTEEDVIKVALLKDIYKATMYEMYMKNVKDDISGQWSTIPAYKTREATSRAVFGNAGLSSYMQIKKYVELTDEQIESIIYSSPQSFEPDIHEVMRAYPLVTLTRMAEMIATYFN
jgi:nicotinic acid phosphoribosyltransferase